jgi:hypothetical protein
MLGGLVRDPLIAVADFDRTALDALFHFHATEVEYLWSYLSSLRAGVFLTEAEYIDRHYLDDYTTFYAQSFRPPPVQTRRVHFFAGLGAADLERRVSEFYGAANDRKRQVEDELAEAYLGFVVLRPLDGAPIGRTVLRTYPEDGRRQYTVVRPYRVHVGGLCLSIDGLAYQQQDKGAAVCASTALWSALQKVAQLSGHRTPTPSAITAAAKSPFAASHGLNDAEMAAALATLGYSAEYFSPGENIALFKAKLATYLRSHLPVVLLLSGPVDDSGSSVCAGHAVTVTGYAEPSSAVLVGAPIDGLDPLVMRDGALEILYVHDDNLGSHAHYELLETVASASGVAPDLMVLRGKSQGPKVDWWTPDRWKIDAALVPKPRKLRMPVQDLLLVGWAFRRSCEQVFPNVDLEYSMHATTGVGYRGWLRELALFAPADLRQFNWTVHLPRHLGVVRVAYEHRHVCDFLVDVTTVERLPYEDSHACVACVAPGVPCASRAWANLDVLCRSMEVPLLAAC